MFVTLRQEYVLTRNQMARQIRKKSGTGVYHVMLRGINRQDIFEDGLLTDIIQSLEKTRRNVVLRSELSFGAGIRQLSRLTGISFGVIQKLKNDQERSALPLSLSVATERTDPADSTSPRPSATAILTAATGQNEGYNKIR